MTRRRAAVALVAGAALAGTGAMPAAASPVTTKTPVVAFQAAGDVGGGVLVPGTTFPPGRRGTATLRRGRDALGVTIRTSGLPPGAYTVWWVIFDNPEGCSGSCDGDDLFNPDAAVSVFWATGGVVGRSGNATFTARYRAGDDLGDPGTQHILGDGGLHPQRAEVHSVVKYHGPAANDAAARHAQLTTLRGGCDEGANALDLGPPFGVQCFDPQVAVHHPPASGAGGDEGGGHDAAA